MNSAESSPQFSSLRSFPLVRAALVAAGLLSSSAFGQVQKAGDLFVEVDATKLSEGPVASVPNTGTLAGVFAPTGTAADAPTIALAGGTKGLRFDGTDYLQLVSAVGSPVIPPPAGLVGEDPTRSIEVWAINPEVSGEETLVSWGKRGGPDGSNVSFGYGSDFRWGAVGHWGGDGPDIGWNNAGGSPPANKWHHLVYTFDGATHTSRVYADGQLANFELLDPARINTHPDTSINMGNQLEADGITVTGGLRYSGTIARVRIHDGVLTAEQILNNYNAEKADFIDPPPPAPPTAERLTKGPVHRYTFSDTAAPNATGMKIKDSVGTADGVVQGDGAAFSGSRLVLAGGSSSTQAFADLPNNLVSNNSTNKGGTGEFAFETWVKITGARTWSRIFDFGSTTSDDGSGEVVGPGLGGTGLDYLEYSAQIDNDVNSRRLEIRNEDPAGGGIVTADVSTSTFNTDVHVLVSWKESTGRITVYENGKAIGGLTTDDPMSDLNDVNVWLGRSAWSGDQNTQGEFDEARFYDFVPTAGQVLGDFLAGPDLVNAQDTPVTLTSQPASLTLPDTVTATFRASARGSTPITFQWYRDGVPIAGATEPSYTIGSVALSDSGSIFTVDAINTSGGNPVKASSSPATLTVFHDQVALKHRYSFGETSGTQVKDSVGTAHGDILGGITLGGGQATLDGSAGTYINLPNGLVTELGDNGTIEMWVTYSGGPPWSRVFDFGSSLGGEDVTEGFNGADFIFYTPKSGPGFARFTANFPDNAGDTTTLAHPGSTPINEQEHIIITYSSAGNTARLFVNGTQVATSPAPIKLSAMNNTDNNIWLGRSQFGADAYFAGKYNEFRLYTGAMTPSEVAASAAAGPDNLPSIDKPTISIARDGANVKITFSGSLEGADAVTGSWNPVAGSSPLTVPTSGTQKYYRSKQ